MDYIEFFYLDVDGSTEIMIDSEGLQTSDYFSFPVFIENGIPIGARDELTTVLYVRIYSSQCFCLAKITKAYFPVYFKLSTIKLC